eukprot:7992026-Pyramimonas_sp.AAC.1
MESGPPPNYQETRRGPQSATRTHIPRQEKFCSLALDRGWRLRGPSREDTARISRAEARIQRVQATQGGI